MNIDLLKTMIDQGYVVQQKHDHHNLFIFNYTAKAQYDKVWNEITLQCRGLILNDHYQVVARPFVKFFNLEECNSIPSDTFEVYEKMDGSLGILYWINDQPFIATRGSFHSEQAVKATQWLQTKYKNAWHELDRNYTYLFEIIYPENRIVVNYGEQEELVLLAVIHTESGEERKPELQGFPVVKRYDGIRDIHALKGLQEDNREGFVVKFSNGYRLKIKFEEYVRLHYLITQVSSRVIWEYLSQNMPMDKLLQAVPDEFYNWVRKTSVALKAEFSAIEQQCAKEFKVLDTRKETAAYFLTCDYPAILFLMLDGKPIAKEIWKRIKPPFSKPFKKEE